ncbi:MAG: ATP-binding cassette domain-containing protein, partial [Prevotella sp.]|nr:ATP-binding cassette domain-containing protein [Prevotella sp.]
MMLVLQNIACIHPNKDVLFNQIYLAVNRHDKAALIGNNGVGKTTLLQIIADLRQPSEGTVCREAAPYYVPQIFGQYNHLTIAEALKIADKLHALKEILDGNVTEANLALLNDDWDIEERCRKALDDWKLDALDLQQKMETLSGGEKTKVFLAGISVHRPEFILLDEPTNHLDTAGRQRLYDFIQSCSATLLVVSHDRKLLNLLHTVCELSRHGIRVYGGNYDFYAVQKLTESRALQQDVQSREKALRKAKEKERETWERRQRQDARGAKQQKKEGMSRIMMDKMKNDAEKSTSRLQGVHAEKIAALSQSVSELRKELPDRDKMKFDFDNSALHKGKILVKASGVNYCYGSR